MSLIGRIRGIAKNPKKQWKSVVGLSLLNPSMVGGTAAAPTWFTGLAQAGQRTVKGMETKFEAISGQKAAKDAARLQRESILRQRQQEMLALAEDDDEMARRKYLARFGGRRSLMAGGSLAAQGRGTTSLLGG